VTLRHEPVPARYESIHSRVRWWCEAQPTAVAVTAGDVELTYAELDARAESLAAELRAQGVGRETAVGVAMPRSPDFVIAALGVLKAGGYYVPIDPGYPAERQELMVGDAGLRLMVCEQAAGDRWAAAGLTSVPIRGGRVVTAPRHVAAAPRPSLATQLAYVVYTSGSTGRPKGVAVTHHNVLNLMEADPRLRIASGDVVAQLAPTSFDASIFEIWCALGNGAQVAFLAVDELSIATIERDLRARQPDWLFLTTGLFHALMERRPDVLDGIRHVITGGDVLSPKHIGAAAARSRGRTMAAYGPTEATVFSSLHVIEVGADDEQVPLGTALAGRSIAVLDGRQLPVPDGVAGEICLGGAGVTRGYLGRPAETAAAFVPDPAVTGGRLYRTGDLGRRRPDGVVEFLGRIDRQVKIRGFRVEPGEVEAALDTADGVHSAVVVAVPAADGEKRLVAYVVTAPDSGIGVAELRVLAGEKLPAYARPSYFVVVDELPLDPNGKVDRSRLPEPWRSRDRLGLPSFEPPRTSTEELLAALLAELLGLDRIGRDDDFFALGGTSLQSVQVLERLRGQGLPVTSREFFGNPTVADLAHLLDSRTVAATPGLVATTAGPA
jgi:amino acid adenylation domain-containing protein